LNKFTKKATNAPKTQPIAMDIDDEEEATILLTSEFQATPTPTLKDHRNQKQ
jgi:hypothetical protein